MKIDIKLVAATIALAAVVLWPSTRPSEARRADMSALERDRGTPSVQVAEQVSSDPDVVAGREMRVASLRPRVPPLSPEAVDVFFDAQRYWYDDGLWYLEDPSGWSEVSPPAGIKVRTPPSSYTTLWVDGVAYYYAYGVYYVPVLSGYAVANVPH